MTTDPSPLLFGLGIGTAEAVLVSAIIGILSALMVVRRHRGIAKRAKAYDVAKGFFRARGRATEEKLKHMAEKKNWLEVTGPAKKRNSKTRQKVLEHLNEWELMCVGIRKGIVDENVLRDVIGDRLVVVYGRARGLIEDLRNQANDREYYEHFEFIAKKWDATPRYAFRDVFRTFRWHMRLR